MLRKFADIVEDLALPEFPYDAMAGTIIDAEAASAFESLFQSGRITELTAPEDRIGGYAGQVLLAKDYLRALRLRRPAGAALDRLLAGTDAVAAPSLPTVAWPIDAAFDKVYPDYPGGTSIGGAANVCGVPGLFMMNGVGEAGSAHESPAHGARGVRGHAAGYRSSIPGPHRASSPPSGGIVTPPLPAYISWPRCHPKVQEYQ